MQPLDIIFLIIVVIIVVLIIRYMRSDSSKLSSLLSATSMLEVSPADLVASGDLNTSNFTYSIWTYIDDWNYRYGEPKVIFGRMGGGEPDNAPCPVVTLGATQNNAIVSLAVYSGEEADADNADNNYIVHTCTVDNIPVQKWVNLLISVYGRTLDIYIDGKLVRTCVMPGVPKINPEAPLYITPNGGFSGWTAKMQYWGDSCDPQKAWNVYRSGFRDNWLSNIFGKYSIKLSLMEGDIEDSSVTI